MSAPVATAQAELAADLGAHLEVVQLGEVVHVAPSIGALASSWRPAPLMAPTDDDEETRKRLLSIALAGDPVVAIDNVDGELGSGPLAMALTAGVVKDRLLGSTKMVEASLRPVWCFTGNNVRLKGDLGRRVVPIDLDAKCENPEDRTFQRSDLLGYVRG